MAGILQLTSAIAAILAGILICIMWIVAAHDKGTEDKNIYNCRGCIHFFYDQLKDNDTDLNRYYLIHRDSYVLLIVFGAICGLFWMITGGIGFVSSTEMMAKLYVILGIATYTLFVVVFAVIADRLKYAAASGCAVRCSKTDNWFLKHNEDSTHEFWGCALTCFVLGMYQIGGAVYNYATLGKA